MATYYKGDGTQITIPDVGSVNTAQLVDNAVTYNKLAEAVQDQLGTSTETEERLDDIEAQIDELAEAIESVDIETDTTLSISGKPADAKVVGDALLLNKTIGETSGYILANGYIGNAGSTTQEVYATIIDVSNSKVNWYLSTPNSTSEGQWIAYASYSETGAFIARNTLYSGSKKVSSGTIDIPNNVKYIAFTYRTYGTHEFKFGVVKNVEETMTESKTVYDSVVKQLDYTETSGYFDANGNVTTASSNAEVYTNKIDVQPYENVAYRFELDTNTASVGNKLWMACVFYDKTQTKVGRRTVIQSEMELNVASGIVAVPSDVHYIAFTYRTFGTVGGLTINAIHTFDYIKQLESDIEQLELDRARVTYNFGSHTIKGANHRGYCSTAPENTMSAYKLSVTNGFSFVETDVRFTSDDVPVLLHDATVDRTSNGTGNISDMTYAQARELDFGTWKSSEYAGEKIPSFEEFILFCRNIEIYPYVEVSFGVATTSQIQTLVDIVKKYNMMRSVTWISFYIENLETVVGIDDEARVGLNLSSALTNNTADSVNLLKTGKNDVFVNIDSSYANDAVSICQSYDLPLETWVVDSGDTMRALDDYVSGVTSNTLNFEWIKRVQALS